MKYGATPLIRMLGPKRRTGPLSLGAVSSPAFALLPQSFAPLAAVPVGLGLAWLGYSLWSERREPVAQRVPARERAQLSATPAG